MLSRGRIAASLLLVWAAVTLGGFFTIALIVTVAEIHAKTGWVGVAAFFALVSGIFALPIGLALRLKG